MSTSEALTAFVGFDVKLPTGVTVRAQPLPYKTALDYMARLAKYRASPTDDVVQAELVPMVQGFAAAVQLTPAEALDACSFGEVVNVIRTFFTLQRAETELLPAPSPTAETPAT